MLGQRSPEAFKHWMQQGAGAHLVAFCRFVRAKGLADELVRKDWAGFALVYNGPRFAENKYDTKMAIAYRRWSGRL